MKLLHFFLLAALTALASAECAKGMFSLYDFLHFKQETDDPNISIFQRVSNAQIDPIAARD